MDDDQGNAEKIIKEDALVKSGSDTEESIEMKQESEVKNADADHAKSGTLEQSSTAEDKKAPENQALNEENLHYEDGVCIYTEPESKCQFVWDDIKKEWVARDSPGSFSDKDYEYDGKTYKYTDKETRTFVICTFSCQIIQCDLITRKYSIQILLPLSPGFGGAFAVTPYFWQKNKNIP
ncbi:hypothetical protein J6590_035368 [Homalodisca vitripennis]|nr:hypothetical protein J6590_035368 [Homalodisca vitripennis]